MAKEPFAWIRALFQPAPRPIEAYYALLDCWYSRAIGVVCLLKLDRKGAAREFKRARGFALDRRRALGRVWTCPKCQSPAQGEYCSNCTWGDMAKSGRDVNSAPRITGSASGPDDITGQKRAAELAY